ncbi:MAG TPA: nuclear transport factor 2 family protein [Thermoanaerobaculia bacterium]
MRRPGDRLLTALLLAGLISCGTSGDPAAEAVARLEAAADERDAKAFLENLTADFTGAEGADRAAAERLVRGYFAAYEALDVAISGLEIERTGESAARATFVATLTGKSGKGPGGVSLEGLLPSDSKYRFDLRLVPDGDRWKVAFAAWEPVQGP